MPVLMHCVERCETLCSLLVIVEARCGLIDQRRRRTLLRTATCEADIFVVLIQRAGFLVVRADRLKVLLDQIVIQAMADAFEE